jgi:hypothetical protein
MVYDDPRYGKVTPLMNVQGNDELTMATQAMMAAATGGMAMLGAPALAMSGINAARSFGSGNLGGGLGALIGMIPGMSPLLASALRAGIGASGIGQPSRPSQADLAAAMRRTQGTGP